MSRLPALVRTGLKSNFGMAVLYHRIFREKKDRWLVPLIAFSLLGVVPMLLGLVHFIREMYSVLVPMGQEHAVLGLGVLAGQFLILVFGIYYILSAFYFSRDLDMLIPLPVRPSEVLISKFIVLIVNEYLTVAVVVLPFVISFGVLDKGGFGYWVNAALVYGALPVIPLAIVSAVVVAMMRFINISRKKDILLIVGGIAVLAVAFGFQFLTLRAQNKSISASQMAAFLTSPDSLLHRIGSNFPPGIWATKAIAGGFSGEGFVNLAVFMATSLIVFAAMIVLAEKLFYRGAVGLNEISGRRRLLTRDEMSRRVSSGRRAINAIFVREFRIMNRTPVFLLNGVLVPVILPVFFILTARTGPMPPDANFHKLMDSGGIVYILALLMTISGCINGTASSTFSREGTQFWISRVIPVSAKEQVAAKFLHSYLIGALGVVTALIAGMVFFPIRPAQGASAAILALLATGLLTIVGMTIDLARPLLDWTNPQKAIKQNLNVLLAIFADAGVLAAAYFGIRALTKAGLEWDMIVGLMLAALAVLSSLAFVALCRFADKRYGEIE